MVKQTRRMGKLNILNLVILLLIMIGLVKMANLILKCRWYIVFKLGLMRRMFIYNRKEVAYCHQVTSYIIITTSKCGDYNTPNLSCSGLMMITIVTFVLHGLLKYVFLLQ